MVHFALDVHANGTRMHNRGVGACVYYKNMQGGVYAMHVGACVYYMYMAPCCGCVQCGRQDADYVAHLRLRLVL